MTDATGARQPGVGDGTGAWLALLLLAVLAYALGLDGQHIPSNGDEMVYAHIARLTAASQHWLPLVSELENMRNTKPPLLFWQAMVAGNWGQNWQLWALRLPSLVYTLLVTGAIAATMFKLTRDRRSAVLASCVYLAFFCTFRYGRPYLTSAAESFWLNLPIFWLLLQCAPSRSSDAQTTPGVATTLPPWGLGSYVLCGLVLGVGSAYKSFALIAPAAATLCCALLIAQRPLRWGAVLRTGAGCALSSLIALALFSLWLVVDPDPLAVWREFVVGENAGKLTGEQGYWSGAWRGGSSIWAQLLAYLQDAGLLAFVVLGLAWTGWRAWRAGYRGQRIPRHTLVLLAWLAVWLLVFTIPSQRSARYVIPAMPALALLLALYWQRIGRAWFVLTLLLAAPFVALLGRIAWAAQSLDVAAPWQLGAVMSVTALGLGAVGAGLLHSAWTRSCALLACVAVYLCLDLALLPLDGPAGRFAQTPASDMQGLTLAVPNGFNGQFERFEFLLPGNRFLPYDVGERARSRAATGGIGGAGAPDAAAGHLEALLKTHDAVVWPQSDALEPTAPCVPGCRVLAWRWQLKGRHQGGEIHLGNIWYPQEWLFRREWLLQR